jgi:hypothetical protein
MSWSLFSKAYPGTGAGCFSERKMLSITEAYSTKTRSQLGNRTTYARERGLAYPRPWRAVGITYGP